MLFLNMEINFGKFYMIKNKIHCCRVELLQIVKGIATEKFRRFESYPRNNIYCNNVYCNNI